MPESLICRRSSATLLPPLASMNLGHRQAVFNPPVCMNLGHLHVVFKLLVQLGGAVTSHSDISASSLCLVTSVIIHPLLCDTECTSSAPKRPFPFYYTSVSRVNHAASEISVKLTIGRGTGRSRKYISQFQRWVVCQQF